jgi:hypothetical protein
MANKGLMMKEIDEFALFVGFPPSLFQSCQRRISVKRSRILQTVHVKPEFPTYLCASGFCVRLFTDSCSTGREDLKHQLAWQLLFIKTCVVFVGNKCSRSTSEDARASNSMLLSKVLGEGKKSATRCRSCARQLPESDLQLARASSLFSKIANCNEPRGDTSPCACSELKRVAPSFVKKKCPDSKSAKKEYWLQGQIMS